MIRYVALSIALLAGCSTAQYAAPAASYGAPAASYATPDAGYGAPTAPATGYDVAAPAYDYAQPAAGYAAAPAAGGFDIGSLSALIIPILVAIGLIIAAIIIGGGILTFLSSGTTVSLAGLAPLANALLNPLGLSLCTVGPPVAIFNGATTAGRMLSDVAAGYGFDFSEDQMNLVADFARTAFDTVKSQFL